MRLQTKQRVQTTDNPSASAESNFYKFILILLVGIALFAVTDRMTMYSKNNNNNNNNGATTNVHILDPDIVQKKDTHKKKPAASSPPGLIRHKTYQPRGQPMNQTDKEEMMNEYGSWTFSQKRPVREESFYQQFPHRDVTDWPVDAWQRNPEYLKPFLEESIQLVQRAKTAILQEYNSTQSDVSLMFEVTKYDDDTFNNTKFPKEYGGTRGGWTTVRSWKGLKRRLLHAIMTEDSFIVAMTGHSSAAGHGNIFQQSYTLQIQWILEAVFARMGVFHESRNFGMGGMGTGHSGLAAATVFGPDVDFQIWDSSMTEKQVHFMDLIARQQIMAGSKVPIFWNFYPQVSMALAKDDVEVGAFGTGRDGIPLGSTPEQIENELPWATRYVKCEQEIGQICRANEYIGHCWIDRSDFTPTGQKAEPGGRARWHPGNRMHQVTGRIFAMTILKALSEGLNDWYNSPKHLLPNEDWHVTEHYSNIQQKIAASSTESLCYKGLEGNHEMGFFCQYPFQARTEFTPRHAPTFSNIRAIMPPEQQKAIQLPQDFRNIYKAPDVFNPDLHPPKGAIDVLNIVEAGSVPFPNIIIPDYVSKFYQAPLTKHTRSEQPPGLGIALGTVAGDEFCDGTVDSFCNKGKTNNCLLYNHNDGRNGLNFDGYSGWLLFNLPKVENGYIVIKMESYHSTASPSGWTSINNRNDTRRYLKAQPPPYCDDFRFEYMINGQVTSNNLNVTQGMMQRGHIQRVVETLTLLKDPNFSSRNENGEVEVGIRMVGCGHLKAWRLTHVYWS